MDPTPEAKYPLRVFYCTNCGLIQLLDIVNRKEMFDDYVFLTATANTSLSHFEQYADDLTKRLPLHKDDLVVDIGSNDGTLLKAFRRRGAAVLGIEPARNIADRANAEGIETLAEYFGSTTVDRVGPGRAQLITANNVVSHVGDLNGFVDSVSRLLNPNGMFVFEVPWVVQVLRHYNFDIIYHEHLSYFGFKPLSQLLELHDLELIDLEYFSDVHGGSLRGLAAHPKKFPRNSSELNGVFQTETEHADFRSLVSFATQVRAFRAKLMGLLNSIKKDGKTIVGYGAPAKATILLNYCGIDKTILDFVIDTTPLKQGKFIPGVRIPILQPDDFRKAKPDYALLLAWNFKDEILRKEQEYIQSGGRFIIPFPEPRILN